jgi:hypothetical protein
MELELELEFFSRPTVSRPVSLGIGPPFGTLDQILSRSSSFDWQLRRFDINASSLTRKRVCNLLYNCFWALPEQPHLSRSPTELTAISYCLIWDSFNLEGQVPVFISPRNRVAQLYPRALCSLSVASYDSRGLRWKYSNPPPHGFPHDEKYTFTYCNNLYIKSLAHKNHSAYFLTPGDWIVHKHYIHSAHTWDYEYLDITKRLLMF